MAQRFSLTNQERAIVERLIQTNRKLPHRVDYLRRYKDRIAVVLSNEFANPLHVAACCWCREALPRSLPPHLLAPALNLYHRMPSNTPCFCIKCTQEASPSADELFAVLALGQEIQDRVVGSEWKTPAGHWVKGVTHQQTRCIAVTLYDFTRTHLSKCNNCYQVHQILLNSSPELPCLPGNRP